VRESSWSSFKSRVETAALSTEDTMDAMCERFGPVVAAVCPCAESLPMHPKARELARLTMDELEKRGTVYVTLQKASHLRGADKAKGGGTATSDPYAILDLHSIKRKSRTVLKTVDPVWNQTFSWNGVLRVAPCKAATTRR
jgi:hypothetical protein